MKHLNLMKHLNQLCLIGSARELLENNTRTIFKKFTKVELRAK